MSKNVSWDRVTDLKKTALQVCELLRKEKPIPKELLDSLEALSHRKRKPEDPRLLEMFAAGAKVADIAAAVGKTTATVYGHRREWLKKNPATVAEPVAEVKQEEMPGDSVFQEAYDESSADSGEMVELRLNSAGHDLTKASAAEVLDAMIAVMKHDNECDSVSSATDEAVSPVTEIEPEDDSRYLEISYP